MPSGLAFEVRSEVPHASGVSSSAALEIATLRALADYFEIDFAGTELARLGQVAENRVVGAPCGLMDQLAARANGHEKTSGSPQFRQPLKHGIGSGN